MQVFVGPWLAIWLTLSYLLPNHYAPWLSFHQEALAVVAFVPLCYEAMRVGNLRVSALIGLLLLSLLPVLQLVVGHTYFFGDALAHSFFIAAGGWAFLAGQTGGNEADGSVALRANPGNSLPFEYLLSAILTASIVSVGLIMYQWLGLDWSGLFVNDVPKTARPFGNLAQPNHQSLLLAIGIVAIWRLWESRQIGTTVALISLGWLLIGVVLTDSRAFYLGATSFLVIMLLLRGRCTLRLSLRNMALIVVGYIFLSYFLDEAYRILLLENTVIGGVARIESIHSRAIVWQLLLKAFEDQPWFGFGWGMVASAQFEHAHLAPGVRELFFNAHNWVLDLLIQTGAPITLAIVLAVVWWFVVSAARCRNSDAVAMLLVPVLVLTYSMVEFQYTYAYFLLPAAYCAGWAMRRNLHDATDTSVDVKRGFRSRTLGGSIFLATSLLGVAITYDYMKFEEVWRRERFVLARIDPDGPRPEFHPFVLTNLRAMLELERAQSQQSLDALGLEKIGATASRYPYIPFVIKWARTLLVAGEKDHALRRIELICAREGTVNCLEIKKAMGTD